jgi:hypothetical protein
MTESSYRLSCRGYRYVSCRLGGLACPARRLGLSGPVGRPQYDAHHIRWPTADIGHRRSVKLLRARRVGSPDRLWRYHPFARKPGARPRPWSGIVTVTGPGVHRDVLIGASGTHSVMVPAGSYTVTGHSPLYGGGAGLCQAAGVARVTSGHGTRAHPKLAARTRVRQGLVRVRAVPSPPVHRDRPAVPHAGSTGVAFTKPDHAGTTSAPARDVVIVRPGSEWRPYWAVIQFR